MYSKDEMKALKREFWTEFAEYCNTDAVLSKRRTKFMLYNTRVKGIEMKWVVEPKLVEVVMEFNHPSDAVLAEQWTKMESCKSLFSKGYGRDFDHLIWDDNYELAGIDKTVKRIYLSREGLNFHRRSDWPEIFVFMGQNMHKMEKAWKNVKPFFEE